MSHHRGPPGPFVRGQSFPATSTGQSGNTSNASHKRLLGRASSGTVTRAAKMAGNKSRHQKQAPREAVLLPGLEAKTSECRDQLVNTRWFHQVSVKASGDGFIFCMLVATAGQGNQYQSFEFPVAA